MTSSTQKKVSEQPELASTEEASISDVLSAWDKVVKGFKVKFKSHTKVVLSDFHLSVKAIIVMFISMMALVCLGIILWVTLLVGLVYGLMALEISWVWCMITVLGLNGIALVVVKRIFTSAIKSIGMKTSADLIFSSSHHSDNK